MKARERARIPDDLRGKPLTAFEQQRVNAVSHRGISWELTFDQWWSLWQQSGHWLERGRGSDKYCMCRKDDVGPYSVDNVFIATNAVNISTAQKAKHSDLPLGVRANRYGKFYATKTVRNVQRHIGTFTTPELASAAYRNF